MIFDTPYNRSLFDALCRQWYETLGISIKHCYREGSARELLSEGQCIGTVGILPDYLDGDWYLRCCVDDYISKPTGWKCEAYDRLIQSARSEIDQGTRLGIYQQADRILTENVVIVPVQNIINIFLVKPWVKRYPIFHNYTYGSWKDVVIEAHGQ